MTDSLMVKVAMVTGGSCGIGYTQTRPIESDMVPAGSEVATIMGGLTILGRIGSTADAAFLLGPESIYITGTTPTIDGGPQTL